MFERIFEEIKKYDSIVIFGHVFPDGDCYGCQMALKEVLSLQFPQKKIYAVGSGCKRFIDLLGPLDEVDDDCIKKSLAVLVDGNDFSRAEDKRIALAKAFIKLDHHVDVGTFTQGEFVVNEEASSACEILTDMIQEIGLPINEKIANSLMLGLITDTGRFQFVTNYPKTFAQAGWLSEKGADLKYIIHVLNMSDESSLSFKGYVFSNYKKTATGTIYVILDKETLHKYNISAARAGNMVNLISNLNGYPIWVFFCENDDGTTHTEFRSNGPAVQPVALANNGGGHMLASGCTLPDFKIETIEKVVSQCDEAILMYQKGE